MTHRTFISFILAAALAVTGMTSTPAQAGNDDVAKWIAGGVALGLLGAAIAHDKKKSRKRKAHAHRHQTHDAYNQSQHHRPQKHHKAKKHHKKQYQHDSYSQPRGHDRFALPGQCRRTAKTTWGKTRGYGRHCLLNNYSHFNGLPHKCAIRGHSYQGHGALTLYGRDCMRQHGYYTAGSR